MRLLRSMIVACTALVLVACGDGDSRPTVAEWQPRWERARDLLPGEETLLTDGEDACGTALGQLRSTREELLDTPRPVLDDSVGDWLAQAEALTLDCPHEEDEVTGRLEDLSVLAAAVDAGLEATESTSTE